MRAPAILALSALIAGCSSTLRYDAPMTATQVRTFAIIDKPKAAAWDAFVAEAAKSFFVVNNMDRSSGFINLSYTGDPDRYVDCGFIMHTTSLGKLGASFPGAQGQARFTIERQGYLVNVDRRMSLDGRINVVLQDEPGDRTRLNVNVRYVLTRTTRYYAANGSPGPMFSDTASMNTNGEAVFSDNDGNPLRCRSKGALEESLLQLVR